MKRVYLVFALIFFFSGSLFSQSITVTKPNSRDVWGIGCRYNINWTKTGRMDSNVKIRLFNSTGTIKIIDITNGTSNDGSFSWTIPASLSTGNYRIRVKTIDNTITDDSEPFQLIENCIPNILVLNPLNLCKGDPFIIKWTRSGSMDANVKIKLLNADLSLNTTITMSTPNDGSYSWTVPVAVADGSYRLRIRTVDNAVWDDTAPFNMSGCSSVCKIIISAPCPEGSTVTLLEKKSTNILWDPSFSPGGNVRINMTYANCPGESGPVLLILYTLAVSTPNDGNFTWATPDVKGVKCYKISINKIGTKCSGRTGIIRVIPRLEKIQVLK